MATVAIWKIESNLKQVLNYTTDKEKTNENIKDLDNVLSYIKDEFKTEKKLYVDGINCNPSTALEEMNNTKRKFMKNDGVLAWHAYQSFKEGEVTPEEAHNIGLEVAKEMWGDNFQVVVSTHLNTKHYHNHFVINSVSFIDGKKYNANRTSYAEFRRISNEICMEHGKSYLEEKKTKGGLNYINYQRKNIVYSNYYKTAKRDIDLAIENSFSFDEFKRNIINLGYSFIIRSGKISVCNNNYKRNIRIERYFGEAYSIENIKKRIIDVNIYKRKSYKKNSNKIFKEIFKPKYNSFYYLYRRYCYLLECYPKIIRYNYVSNEVKKDLEKLNMYSKEANFLEKNKILTEDDLNSLEKEIKSKINNFIEIKDNFKNISKNSIEYDKLKYEISKLKNQLSLCENIKSRKEVIKKELKNIEEKEMIFNEYIR